MNRCAVANGLWLMSQRRTAARFAAALKCPADAQQQQLRTTLRTNAVTDLGKRHGFSAIDSLAEYMQRVPLCTYDDIAGDIDRVRRGEPGVLTAEPVTRLIPTTGTTSAAKLIPYTAGLQRAFNRAIGPWVTDLFRQHPGLTHGPSYWSISPAVDLPRSADDAVPVGFDDDTAYLGVVGRWLVGSTLAVPNDVRHCADIDDFRYTTLRWLLQARELRLVSVWHPSFWSLLTEGLPKWWGALRDDLARGACTPPSGRPYRHPRLRRVHLPAGLGPNDCRAIWPRLTVISAWADAAASRPFAELQRRWPGVAFQPKGILSTEGFLSIPWRGGYPAAVLTHVIELLGEDGVCVGLNAAEQGGSYEAVLTTAGGLYRYRTGDRVEITGHIEQTPTLKLLGRVDRTHDLCGEKLSEQHVQSVLDDVLAIHRFTTTFVLLAPAEASAPTCYELFLGTDPPCPPSRLAAVGRDIDERLHDNPHYAYARRLGQLLPLSVYQAREDAHPCFLARMQAVGQAAGGTKPTLISPLAGWRPVLTGSAAHDFSTH